jgi:hypothetical protein
LSPKTFSSINSINVFPNGDLETICDLAGVEQKQFASHFESFLPSMASDSLLNEYSINVSEDEEKIDLED